MEVLKQKEILFFIVFVKDVYKYLILRNKKNGRKMPVYEYKCENCGNIFDEFKHTYRENQAVCPKCGLTAKRIMSLTNFNACDLKCQRLFGHDLQGQWTSEKHKAEAKG